MLKAPDLYVSPTLITVDGIVIVPVRLTQPLKALYPIVLSPSLNTTLLILTLFWNAEFSILVTLYPLILAGIIR